MRPSEHSEVRALQLFESMADSNFDSLLNAAYLQTFPPKVDLIQEGDPADFLHIVLEGCTELYSTSHGRETTLAMVRPVGTFILAAVLKDAVYLMSARTTRQTRVLMLPSNNIRQVFAQDEAFARAIVVELANCYRNVVKDHKDLKLRTGIERLANRLLRFHRDQGSNGGLKLPYDKRTLASIMAMTPENLSRAFNTLKPYGVEVNGNSIKLNDVEALKTLAKINPLIDDRST